MAYVVMAYIVMASPVFPGPSEQVYIVMTYTVVAYIVWPYQERWPELVTAWAMRAGWAPLASLAPPLPRWMFCESQKQKM